MISIVSTIPIFFEFETITDSESETSQLDVTNLRTHGNYVIFYKNGFEGVFLVVLPFVIMLCLNAKIIYQMTNARSVRNFGSERRARKEMNLAKVLIAMDLTFLPVLPLFYKEMPILPLFYKNTPKPPLFNKRFARIFLVFSTTSYWLFS